jgi:quinolinate synthase
MLKYMRETSCEKFLMLTECGLSSRLQVEFPNKKLVGSCTLCRYMKSNSLQDILRVLKHPHERDQVHVAPEIRLRALKCIEAMFRYTQNG